MYNHAAFRDWYDIAVFGGERTYPISLPIYSYLQFVNVVLQLRTVIVFIVEGGFYDLYGSVFPTFYNRNFHLFSFNIYFFLFFCFYIFL